MFEGPHATNFGRVSPSNGGSLLLARATVVGSERFNVSFWPGDNLELLV